MKNRSERIEGLVGVVRAHFSGVIKALKEIRDTFVFKYFEEALPTVEQDGEGYAIYLLDDENRELPIEHAVIIMDKIGFISPQCFDSDICRKIISGEYNEKDLLNLQEIWKNLLTVK